MEAVWRNGAGLVVAKFLSHPASPHGSAVGNPKEKIRIEPVETPVPEKSPAPAEKPIEVPQEVPA